MPAASDARNTSVPVALICGFNPVRSMLQMTTGKVGSKPESMNATMNSSHENVSESRKAPRIAGRSNGTVTRRNTCASLAPRSRAACSNRAWSRYELTVHDQEGERQEQQGFDGTGTGHPVPCQPPGRERGEQGRDR